MTGLCQIGASLRSNIRKTGDRNRLLRGGKLAPGSPIATQACRCFGSGTHGQWKVLWRSVYIIAAAPAVS
jgi:hypothetical protein